MTIEIILLLGKMPKSSFKGIHYFFEDISAQEMTS